MMRKLRVDGLVLALVVGLTLSAPVALSGADVPIATTALPVLVEHAAAQDPITVEECGIVLDLAGTTVCATAEWDQGVSGGATSTGDNGHRGSDGGFASVHDVGNAQEDASCSVIIGDITTGDEGNHTLTVDASSVTDPQLNVVGSVADSSVDVFVPDCADAQAETTGGSGIAIEASANDGDDGRDATGEDGDDSNN